MPLDTQCLLSTSSNDVDGPQIWVWPTEYPLSALRHNNIFKFDVHQISKDKWSGTHVGKTSIITRICTGHFQLQCSPTIGASYAKVVLDVDDHRIRFQIWDTAGQERFRSVSSMYYRKTDVAVIVYDITNIQSYEEMPIWVSELRKHAEDDYVLCVLGNKSDLASQRVVERDKAEAFAEYLGALYFETSAKTGEGIMQFFEQVSRQLINSKELKERKESEGDLENGPLNTTESSKPKSQKTSCCF